MAESSNLSPHAEDELEALRKQLEEVAKENARLEAEKIAAAKRVLKETARLNALQQQERYRVPETCARVLAIRDEGCWSEDIIDYLNDYLFDQFTGRAFARVTLSAMKRDLFPRLWSDEFRMHIDFNSGTFQDFNEEVNSSAYNLIAQRCADRNLDWEETENALVLFDNDFLRRGGGKGYEMRIAVHREYNEHAFKRIISEKRAKGKLHDKGAWREIVAKCTRRGVLALKSVDFDKLNHLDLAENLPLINYDSLDEFTALLFKEVDERGSALFILKEEHFKTWKPISPALTAADIEFVMADDALAKMAGSDKLEHYRTVLGNINGKSIHNLEIADLKRHGITDYRHRKRMNSLIMKRKVVHKQPRADNLFSIVKSDAEMLAEAMNEQCCLLDDDEKIDIPTIIAQLQEQCGPFNRIYAMLMQYNQASALDDPQSLWDFMTCGASLAALDPDIKVYEEKHLQNDFRHVMELHVFANDRSAAAVCEHYRKHFKCVRDTGCECRLSARHRRERNNGVKEQKLYDPKFGQQSDCDSDAYAKHVALIQQCDAIHNFFLHSSVRFGKGDIRSDEKEDSADLYRIRSASVGPKDNELDEKEAKSSIADAQPPKSKGPTSTYIGAKEDERWWREIDLSNPDQADLLDDNIYAALVEKCGVFRWQNTHGFAAGSNRELSQLKARFANVKEEALQNDYSPLTKENWNSTLRKSNIFHKSFAKEKLRSKYAGSFNDQITGQSDTWSRGETPELEDIIALKLYTDFDALQRELKKCFRFETIADIANAQNVDDADKRAELMKKLQSFFHWRGKLLIFLQKCGTKLNLQTPMLYHGVNAKMIVKPTPGSLFSGPLSTSMSYHAASSFATPKGFVLKISSQYPRLGSCYAFQAHLASDYPEEQEWLVGSMYARVLEVHTQVVMDLPIVSQMREVFFTVHLFREQIFTMSDHLAHNLVQFLKVLTNECCDAKASSDEDTEILMRSLCQITHQNSKHKSVAMGAEQAKLIEILWHKFDEFRKRPSSAQRVKFDIISDKLKHFFMERSDEEDIETGEKKWTPSFDRIRTVFPMVREIHFKDEYVLDERVLQNLIRTLRRDDCTLEKVHLLYYKHQDTVEPDSAMPKDYRIFKDPNALDAGVREQLTRLGWIIKHGKGGGKGYKIRLEKLNRQK